MPTRPQASYIPTIEALIDTAGCSYSLTAPDNDHIGRAFQDGTPYEHDLLSALRPFIKKADAVVDAGANIGNHSVFFAKVCGARVHAFEPNPVARCYLEKNVITNDLAALITIYSQALGETTGKARLIVNEHGLPSVQTVTDPGGDVDVTTLDSLILEPVAVIKVDVEGREEDVLRGAQLLIARDRPVIAVEIPQDTRSIDAFLRPLGYRRFPLSFASTPTWLYLPRGELAVRLLRRRRVLMGLAQHVRSRSRR